MDLFSLVFEEFTGSACKVLKKRRKGEVKMT